MNLSTALNNARATRSEIASLHEAGKAGHFVHFYEDDRYALESIWRLASTRMAAGDTGVFVVTRPHIETIERDLLAGGLDLNALRAQGRYVTQDADATLSRFMEDGRPNRDKFLEIVGGIVGQAIDRSSNRSVLVFGEMVARLCAEHNSATAIELERLWNMLATRLRFALWCAYPLSTFQGESGTDACFRICSEHSVVVPAETPL